MARSGRRWRVPKPGGFLQCGRVLTLVSIYTLASGAAEAQRWAARSPKSPCRTANKHGYSLK